MHFNEWKLHLIFEQQNTSYILIQKYYVKLTASTDLNVSGRVRSKTIAAATLKINNKWVNRKKHNTSIITHVCRILQSNNQISRVQRYPISANLF